VPREGSRLRHVSAKTGQLTYATSGIAAVYSEPAPSRGPLRPHLFYVWAGGGCHGPGGYKSNI